MRTILAALLLSACASSQPRVCGLSSLQMKEEHASARREVSLSGACDAYPVLSECPAAQQVDAKQAKLWDEWESCRP